MHRDEFFNTYFTNQKELAVMARLGPADRARFLSRILGYEKLREAQDALRARRSELRAEHAGLEQGLADDETLRQERAGAQERLDAARRRVREAERLKAAAERRLAAEGPAWSRMVSLRESVMSLDGERRLGGQRGGGGGGGRGGGRRLAAEGPAWSRMVSLRESVMSLDGERRLAEQRVEEAR